MNPHKQNLQTSLNFSEILGRGAVDMFASLFDFLKKKVCRNTLITLCYFVPQKETFCAPN